MNEPLRQTLRELGLDAYTWDELAYSPGVLETTIAGGEPAIEIWEALRDRYGETGYWPILRGETLRTETPQIMNAPSPIDISQVLAASPSGSTRQIIEMHRAQEHERIKEWLRSQGQEPPDNDDALAELDDEELDADDDDDAPWPQTPPPSGARFSGVFEILTNKPLEQCGLALLPAKHPAHAPAWLGFGGWNEVPPDEVLVGIFLDWHRRYGAVPAVITHDVIEFSVDRPPQTEDEALLLAREQFLVCSDIVLQGTQSIRELGKSLWRAPTWYFWWD